MKLAAYTYLPDGKVDRVDYGNGVRSQLGYDDRGFTNRVQHYRVSPYQNYSARDYYRDTRDRIYAFKKSGDNSINPMENGRGDRFRYDEEGQLVEGWYNATDPANSGAGNTRYDGFSYDALGNRGPGNYVASRGLMDFTKKENGLNQYRAWWPYSYTNYDDDIGGTWGAPGAANGVLMQDGWITGGFDALNHPIAVWSPTYYGTVNYMWFGYDPLGRCVKRWVSGTGTDFYINPATYFNYDGWNLLQEGSNAWGPSRVYVQGNRVDEIVWSNNTSTGEQAFHHYDARGHCTLLTGSDGNILEQYEYDAFGWPYFYDANGNSIGAYDSVQNLWEGYSQFGNRFLFTGREWISDLKLYDYRNRMYQPELGRFMQPDPKEFGAGDYNLYRYCHNDPINKSDPTGLTPGEPFDTIDGAVLDVHNYINATSIRENREYGSVMYQGSDGKFYASEPFHGTGRKVNVGAHDDQSRVPDGRRIGDYHSHGDYSKEGPRGEPVRATQKEDRLPGGYRSDHASQPDKNRAADIHKKDSAYRTFLGTPGQGAKEYDGWGRERPILPTELKKP
jgi:RHS repeat-associated protein